jgi:hypothetical protein
MRYLSITDIVKAGDEYKTSDKWKPVTAKHVGKPAGTAAMFRRKEGSDSRFYGELQIGQRVEIGDEKHEGAGWVPVGTDDYGREIDVHDLYRRPLKITLVVWWEHHYQDGHEDGAEVVVGLPAALRAIERRAKPAPSVNTTIRLFELGRAVPLELEEVVEEVEVVRSTKMKARVG